MNLKINNIKNAKFYALILTSIMISGIFFSGFTQIAFSASQTPFNIRIPEGEEGKYSITLKEGQILHGSFFVSGDPGDKILFWAEDPNSDIIYSKTDVEFRYSFDLPPATIEGKYLLKFRNEGGTILLNAKTIHLGYQIEDPPVENGGGCLIATAAYGTELAPQVQFLREIRDNTVMSTAFGTSFMTGFNQLYYSFSPTIADMERENPMFQEAVRAFITPMISTLSIMTLADDGSEGQVLGLGISVIALNLGMYIAVPTIVIWQIKKRI